MRDVKDIASDAFSHQVVVAFGMMAKVGCG